MDQPFADFPDVASDLIVQPPDLTGCDDRRGNSALQLHREFRTNRDCECSIFTILLAL